jgi:hypothetical protein
VEVIDGILTIQGLLGLFRLIYLSIDAFISAVGQIIKTRISRNRPGKCVGNKSLINDNLWVINKI